MEKEATTTTKTLEEMVEELVAKFMWVFFASTTIGLIVLIETLILNRGCSL